MVLLIILDIFWSVAALIVDLPKLADIPSWAWPLILICPVYPFLLALVWWQISRGSQVNKYLLTFGAIGAVYFGVMALLFYPLTMIEGGFDWKAFGQIFWVAFYASQGAYLLRNRKFHLPAVLTADFYFLAKLIIDFKFKSFGYLEISDLRISFQIALFILALATLSFLTLWVFRSRPR
jgi:hypothetical protein